MSVRMTRRVVARGLLTATRPWCWLVGWVPAYLGVVGASASWWPPRDAVPRTVLGLTVLGPLLWASVLAQNDVHDLAGDRVNPRKAGAPLVRGTVTAGQVAWWARVTGTITVAAALVVRPVFGLGVAAVLGLAWAYSAPPLRLKGRPGPDVAANAVAIGAAAPLAGWSLVRPVSEFPWLLAVFGLLFATAFYLPTTVLDGPTDRAAGDLTFAVRHGADRTFRWGLASWAAALTLGVVCAGLDVLVPRSTLLRQLGLAPVLIAGYVLAARRPSLPRLGGLAVLFLVPTAGFASAVIAAS